MKDKDTTQHTYVIGVLIGWQIESELLVACALAAASHKAELFYFYPSGVDEQRQMIRGRTMRDGEWVKDEFPYPDVIYDRMRRRGLKGYEDVYRQLEHIPLTHSLRGRSIRKLMTYRLLKKDEQLRKYLIPFMTLRNAETALEFMIQHQQTILKSDSGASARGIYTVEYRDDVFEVSDQKYIHRLTRDKMAELIEFLIPQRYCLQKLVRSVTPQGFPFHIRVHMSKDGKGRWIVAFCSTSISMQPERKVTNSEHTFRVIPMWKTFLKHHLGEEPGGELDRRIETYGIQLAKYMQQQLGDGFHEIGLDIGLDEQNRICLFEAGIGLPSTIFHYVEMVRPAIAYSLLLARRHREEEQEQ
ncbi:YheC/YheD family protein [Paenibacillus sp. WLX1005]|uniref:YheC/YheD family protein n=1 Tax=unclassified Paenibacillus TaxID=185978 RepID=UPI00398416E4